MTEENDENISITFKNVCIYIFRYYGFSFIFFSEIAQLLLISSRISNDYLVGKWSYSEDKHSNFKIYCILSFTFSICITFF